MKKIQLSLLSLCLAGFINQAAFGAELKVDIKNIKSLKGSLLISLYDNADNFNKNQQPIKRQKIAVDKNNLTVTLSDIPAGTYAIKAFHDVNDNGEIDFGGSGLPSEPFGSSSPQKKLSPPNFEEAKFTLAENLIVDLNLLP